MKMKRFLASILLAGLGVLILGCDNPKDTTEKKTETKTTQTKDGKITGETKTSTATKTKETTPADGGITLEKTTKTTETTK